MLTPICTPCNSLCQAACHSRASQPRTMRTVVLVAASDWGTLSRRASCTACSYAAYLGVSRSNVSYVWSSRLSCSGCKGTCDPTRMLRASLFHHSGSFREMSGSCQSTCTSVLFAL